MEAARRLSRLKSGALTANEQRAEGAWVYIPYIYTLVKQSRCSGIYASVVSAGDTSWKVWSAYLQSLGPLVCIFLGACMILGQVAYVVAQYWLATIAYQPLASQQRP